MNGKNQVINDRQMARLRNRQIAKVHSNWELHLMLLLPVLLVFVFHYLPLYGLTIAFEKFRPARGLFGNQEWVGLKNIKFILSLPDTWTVTRNTLVIAVSNIILDLIVPVTVALLLNEVRSNLFRRTFQTAVYLPHFLSWVLIAGIMKELLSGSGMVNQLLQAFGLKTVYFLGDPKTFPATMVATHVWKEFGYGTIIYLAALTNIDPTLYEAAQIDGAKRIKQMIYITLPCLIPIIVLKTTLSLGNVLNAGFDQIYNLYSVQVYSTGDIIDTYVYRMGLVNAQYSYATAVGIMKSLVSSVLVGATYFISYKFLDYRIF